MDPIAQAVTATVLDGDGASGDVESMECVLSKETVLT